LRAQRINLAAGGVVIAPWELDDLPVEWLEAAEALIDDLPRLKRDLAKVEQVKNELKKRVGEHGAKHS
jgi:hypothetical protein